MILNFRVADFQQALARDRLGIETDILPGGHLIALSQPAVLARFRPLDWAVRRVAQAGRVPAAGGC